MKIALFVNIIDQPGGAEIGTWRLAERFAQRGHEVTVVSTKPLRRWRDQALIDYAKNIRIIRLPVWQRSPRTFRRMLTIQALWALPLLLHDTHILHLRGLTPETLTLARIARKLGIKTLCVPMASGTLGDLATFPSSISYDASVFKWISTLTEPMRAEIVSWGFPQDRTGVIPNGVDAALFHPSEHPVAEPRVIFVGQFRPEKRVDLLLQAWQRVQCDYPKAQLTLVGGGRNLPEFEQQARRLGLAPTFIPNTDSAGVFAHLQVSNIFVLPGISEGMSNALLEAMAVGLAPLVSDTPANRAVITPEIDGLCYDAESPQALASQLMRLIADTPLRQRLGTAARKTVLQRFTLDAVADQYLALYTRLLAEDS